MVFSSSIFLFGFLPPVLVIYLLAGHISVRARNLVLLLAGYVFYGWETPQYIPLMFATTSIDWAVSLVVAGDDWRIWRIWGEQLHPLPSTRAGTVRSLTQKRAIWLSVISNLAMLGYFKYFNFLFETYVSLLRASGHAGNTPTQWVWIILPLGISFYTFQSLSYTIDVYRGDAKAMGNFIDFACFVSMFPHLVAGPILKFSFLAEQLEKRSVTVEKFARGVTFFALGLTKKVLIANTCATIADAAFGASSVAPKEAWWGALAYAFQIFFDFSGYSDMAIGLGLMLGFVFARNFDAPYRSLSVTDFWRRWHISLSTWLREYLYIPLGGNRKGSTRTYINLLLTMLLGGLWHGASWTYVIWGALHGCGLAWERWWAIRNKGREPWAITKYLRPPLTFLFVLFGWVFFRATSWARAMLFLQCMLGIKAPSATAAVVAGMVYSPLQIWTMVLGVIAVWVLPDTWEWTQSLPAWKAVFCFGCLCGALLIMSTQTYQPFIYYIF